MLLTALAIRIESKGPVIYKSKRVGEGYKLFEILKFRSMHLDADSQINLMNSMNQYGLKRAMNDKSNDCPFCRDLKRPCSTILNSDEEQVCENLHLMRKTAKKGPAFFKISGDPRVTSVGKFIRKTSIDELPQLINILRGDMSLIGNRPLPLYESEKLTTDIAIDRFNAPAGLTGLWQVTKRGKRAVSESERIQLDNQYSREWSFKTDAKIFFKTFRALFQSENV